MQPRYDLIVGVLCLVVIILSTARIVLEVF